MMCSSWKTHLRGSEAPPSAKIKPVQTLKRRQRASSRFAAQKSQARPRTELHVADVFGDAGWAGAHRWY